jgi:hypothetical protein
VSAGAKCGHAGLANQRVATVYSLQQCGNGTRIEVWIQFQRNLPSGKEALETAEGATCRFKVLRFDSVEDPRNMIVRDLIPGTDLEWIELRCRPKRVRTKQHAYFSGLARPVTSLIEENGGMQRNLTESELDNLPA